MSLTITHNPHTEGISCLAWGGNQLIACGSWDNNVTTWKVDKNHNGLYTTKISQYSHNSPVLCVCFDTSASFAVSGGCDNRVLVHKLGSNFGTLVGEHQGPVKTVHTLQALDPSIIMTGSFDKTIRIWDVRAGTKAVHILIVKERIRASSVLGYYATVASANNQLLTYDIRNPKEPLKNITSPFDGQQIRAIDSMHDMSGYAVGSAGGRLAMIHFDSRLSSANFVGRCHRQELGNNHSNLYAVNAISFHPKKADVFCTFGSDCKYSLWNKALKTRISESTRIHNQLQITSGGFNKDGNLLAFSLSYDWSMGPEFVTKENHLCLREISSNDLQKRSRESL
jgi:mRNA export factor